MSWYLTPAAQPNEAVYSAALAHQLTLTKPPGALGALETVAVRFAAMQGVIHPSLNKIAISIFAADHGVAAQGVSAFPQAVTTEMVKNFANGGAAISVLARHLGARFEVVNLGTLFDVPEHEQIVDVAIAQGTADFSQGPAMTPEQLEEALYQGQQAAFRAKHDEAELFIGGEMGIGNTTSASALAAARLGLPAASLVGPGTGLASEQLPHKAYVIEQSLEANPVAEPTSQLQALGGFEIAGLVGAYIACAQLRIPVLVDGFISSAAALMAVVINPSIKPWLLYSHESAEPGHQTILAELDADPLLNIGMRLGEGSGAAVVVTLMQQALALHNEMATFEQAQVSEKTES